MTFHVDSEVGQLRQVIVHRPGLELTRLTPDNVDDLLFDDVMWADRARAEHDAFVAPAARPRRGRAPLPRPARRGARRAGRPRVPAGAAHHGDAVRAGPGQAARRARRVDAGARLLAELLIGGVLKRDVVPCLHTPSLLMEYLDDDDFLLRPAAQPPVPARQLGLDLRRPVDQPDGQAGPQAGDDQLPGRLQLPPDVPRRRASTSSTATTRWSHEPATVEGGDVTGHRQRRRDDRHG